LALKNVKPARKYGKNETTLRNVLKLVKALLDLADGKIPVPGDKLKATLKVEWVKEDELLISGKVQPKHNNRTKNFEKGITKEDLWTLVECLGEALELPQPKDEKNKPTEAERKANAVQDILYCLEHLEILARKPSEITKGFWKFSLKLKHQTASKEDNLKVIKKQWKIIIGSVTVETSPEKFVSEEKTLNWQEICRQNLAQQKQLTTNRFTNAYGVTPQLDEIYVPLAIVERKPPKFPSRNQQEEKEEEKLIPIAEESFFEEVLRQGKSDISQGRKIAIIGEPGSGKTTRLQKIADRILEQDLGLPIWISLADLTQPTITQYIEEIWLKQTGQSLTIDELTQHKDRIWLLLDGLDEMTSRVETRHVTALLGGWVQAARVVVTCRVNVWEADQNAFSGFDVFRNLPFNPEQVTKYIRDWFAEIGDAAMGESLEAALAQSENSRLKELIQNPLRLWMLCQIWQTGGGLPETQAGLYGQFVDWVYRWKADEEILDQREAIDKALARLALAAMEQKDEVSRLRLRESWVLKVLGSRPIFQAVMKLGWLNRVERFPEAICVFYHATFQEYFAALAVHDWDDFLSRNHVNFPVVGKEYRIFEPQWKQVILLWLGRGNVSDKEKEGFITALIAFEDKCGGLYKFQAYFLAALGLAEFESNNIELVKGTISDLIIYSFGYLDEEQNWITFPNEISDLARITLQNTNPKKTFVLLNEWCVHFHELNQSIKEKNLAAKNFFDQLVQLSSRILYEIESKFTQRKSSEIEIELYCSQSLNLNFTGFDLNDSNQLTTLLNLVCTTNDNDIIVKSIFALGQLEEPKQEVIDTFILLMNKSINDRITLLAANAILQFNFNQEALNKLVGLTQSLDEFSCFLAAGSLLDLSDKDSKFIDKAIDIWLDLLFTGTPDIRLSTVNSLKWKLQNQQIPLSC